MVYEGYHEIRYGREEAHAEEGVQNTDAALETPAEAATE
jgi:hypothetical protein